MITEQVVAADAALLVRAGAERGEHGFAAQAIEHLAAVTGGPDAVVEVLFGVGEVAAVCSDRQARLRPEIAGGPHADPEDDEVGRMGGAVVGGDRVDVTVDCVRALDGVVGEDMNPGRPQADQDALAHLGVQSAHHAVPGHERGVKAAHDHGLGHFEADVTATDDDRPALAVVAGRRDSVEPEAAVVEGLHRLDTTEQLRLGIQRPLRYSG